MDTRVGGRAQRGLGMSGSTLVRAYMQLDRGRDVYQALDWTDAREAGGLPKPYTVARGPESANAAYRHTECQAVGEAASAH